MKTLIVLLSLLQISRAEAATSWQVYRSNNRGAHKLTEKAFHGAYQDFNAALAEDPLNPLVQLNLGLAFELNEEYEKAEQAYQAAAELGKDDPAIQFVALFNTGSVRGKNKNVDGALAAYQGALDLLKPDSPEVLKVKTNIELLVQSGGGGGGQGGGGGGQDQKNKEKGGGQDQKQQQQPQQRDNPQNEPQKKQPRPFESKELTPQDVKKILDEIKNQEQAIRAQDYKKGQKDSARGGKDW